MCSNTTGEAVASGPAVVILTPVFNDWASLKLLLAQLDSVLYDKAIEAQVIAIDDGSTLPFDARFPGDGFKALRRVEIVRLRRNLGHQRAIAIGLSYVHDRVACEAVVLMDSDGEDDPRDVPRLLEKYRQEGGEKIIFAERKRRSESWTFRLFYSLYKFLHFLLTSRGVRVGNFSVVPAARLDSLVVISEMWNHYAAAAFKSRQPLDMIPTARAKRLVGTSKMNFVSLVTHGLSAISVYGDIISVRLLVMSIALGGLAAIGLGAVVGIRLLTDLAIPGWATLSTGLLAIILLQAIMFSLVFSFIILNSRQAASFLPCRDYFHFVGQRKVVYEKA